MTNRERTQLIESDLIEDDTLDLDEEYHHEIRPSYREVEQYAVKTTGNVGKDVPDLKSELVNNDL